MLKARKICLDYNWNDLVDQRKIFDVHFIGFCNGLICKISAFPRGCCGVCYSICICNPITKECVVLPIQGRTYIDSGIFGFGVDPRGKYKVIQMFEDDDGMWKGEIITLGECSWRELIEIPQQLNCSFIGKFQEMLFMDGSLYFIVNKGIRKQPVILMFDMHDEKFSIIEFPPSMELRYLYHMRLTVIMDSLAIYQHEVPLSVHIWMIEINKSKNNLRYQQFPYVNLDNFSTWPYIYGLFSLVGKLSNSMFLFKLNDSSHFLVYCMERKRVLHVEVSGTFPGVFQTENFVPSLISPIVIACGKTKNDDTRSELLGLNLEVVGYSSLSEFMDSSSYLSQPFRVKQGFCHSCSR
ncbi:hypothetical protein NE237_026292 [Protea cynaroides]|uniref:F-box associated beta-propeller type 3 domain-containing protein n=1 Tax=Protea cynaroides TaxID=273540 RepID=A0A9Q0H3H3_9MAGN|nr:hypothetical protein NE237_026292 [Protea cynaroides]